MMTGGQFSQFWRNHEPTNVSVRSQPLFFAADRAALCVLANIRPFASENFIDQARTLYGSFQELVATIR